MMDENRENIMNGIWQPVVALACLLIIAGIVVACGSGSSGTTASGMATVSVMLSDPATCAAPDGPYANVWVTITDVQANVSSTASSTDSGWVDLTPALATAPKQVDLLAQATNQCFLATLGDSLQLQAGSYQQIRLILADNTTAMTSNSCTNGAANCVVLTSDGSVHTLTLASEDKTGIKIPTSQITSGAFTIAAGQTKDLDIDFNTCSSIVQAGNSGQYILKPVLHAGEVSATSNSINGTVLDASTGKPLQGAVSITLEQPVNGVDRPVAGSMWAGTDGTFVFCPLTAGNPSAPYDVVIVGESNGVEYAPAIITGISIGDTLGTVKLNPPTTALAATSFASLNGQVTSAGTAGAISEMIDLSVLETVNNVIYTIPQQVPTTPFGVNQLMTVTTATTGTPMACTTGTDCYDYSLPVPSSGAYYAAWSSSGSYTLTPSTTPAGPASYMVDGQTSGCTTSNSPTPANAVTGTATGAVIGVTVSQALTFTGCS